jgi:hypothetical protein
MRFQTRGGAVAPVPAERSSGVACDSPAMLDELRVSTVFTLNFAP